MDDLCLFQGKNLNLVLTKDDVLVKVDDAFCNVTSIADEQLTCRPPGPHADGITNSPKVTVSARKFRNLDI